MTARKALLVIAALSALLTAPRASGRAEGDQLIGDGRLRVTVGRTETGMELSSIADGEVELLGAPSPLFTLYIGHAVGGSATAISSSEGWDAVEASNNGTNCRLVFSQPGAADLPDALTALVTVRVTGSQSRWDMTVTGLGPAHTLLDVDFPDLDLRAPGEDQLLIPKYSGVLVPDPGVTTFDHELLYPRGWSATMQFLSYFNDRYGVYLGFHDPDASIKRVHLHGAGGELHVRGNVAVSDRTLAGNDWEVPGHFELDLFDGDWFDAATIYRAWASKSANYWPRDTADRALRQRQLGRVAVWAYYSSDVSTPISDTARVMRAYVEYFAGLPVGIHWYKWNYSDFDDDYPDYFPERTGMTELVDDLQRSGDTYVMPYINGRLYDTDLVGQWDYATRGFPGATKKGDGTAYTQNFNGNTFAVMCPSQAAWQTIIAQVSAELTERIGTKGLYIDMVAAASPKECMDPRHGHPLGGGHWWRDGYRDMFARIHDATPPGRFTVVEGAADYLADQVDGFLTDGWLAQGLVPAFQVVYGGRVQLVGKRTGASRYHNQSFYCKLSQALVHGIQPGRTSSWIVSDPNADIAAPFVRMIATMRHKLEDYLSFGTMLRPLTLHGDIPTITSKWLDYGTPVDVTISAIQSSVHQHPQDGSLALLFVNASMTEALDFSFDVVGTDYGFPGALYVRRISAAGNGEPRLTPNSFTHEAHLDPLDSVAFTVTPTYTVGGVVSGLAPRESLILRNRTEDLKVTANGNFTFRNVLRRGESYEVTVSRQPQTPGEECVVTRGSGVIAAANITDVLVDCRHRAYLPGLSR